MTGQGRLSDRMRSVRGTQVRAADYNDMTAQAVALEARAERADELEQRAAQLQVYEPPMYGPGSGGRHSWFRDMAVTRASGADPVLRAAAVKRLHDSQVYEQRRTARALEAAERLTAHALTATRREAELYERWQRAGGRNFDKVHEMRGMEMETRALSRTDGQGGYFTPPGWFVDQFAAAPREGSPFASLWTSLPLPPGVASVNVPRFSVGTGSGAQVADGGPMPNRDLADGTVSSTLITIAAYVDVSMQWLEQTPVPPDETLGSDIAADFAMQLDGQLLLGSGTAGQAQGVIPAGAFSAANSVWLQNTANASGMSWANGAGATPGIAGSMHTSAAQLRSKIRRYRGVAPTAWVVPPSVMEIISGSGVDAQDRPLVPPAMDHPASVPVLHWTPVTEDANLPVTFGGTTAPYMGVTSAGVTSPADGNGTYAPMLLGKWSDCVYWQSEPQVTVMTEVLSGTLQARFRVYCYVAAIPNRVQWAGTNQTFSAASQGGGVNTGASVSYGLLTQTTTNGILQPASLGF